MPFINGKYLPAEEIQRLKREQAANAAGADNGADNSSAVNAENTGAENAGVQKPAASAAKEKPASRRGKRRGKEQQRELTPQEKAELEAERDRKAAESAAAFELLISTDKPDLTNYHQLVKNEKKHARRVHLFRGNAQKMLTVVLVLCIFGIILGMSFASAAIALGSMGVAVVASVLYFIFVPR